VLAGALHDESVRSASVRTGAGNEFDFRKGLNHTAGENEVPEYHPPSASLPRLGGIVDAMQSATRIEHSFKKGGKAIFKLEGGELYYDSLLDLDTDGSRFAAQDATGQSDTSLHQPDGKPVDSDSVPFFRLAGKLWRKTWV